MTTITTHGSRMVEVEVLHGPRAGQKRMKRELTTRSLNLSPGDPVELDIGLRSGPVRGVVHCSHFRHVCIEIEVDGRLIEGKGCYGSFMVPYSSPLHVWDLKPPPPDTYRIRRLRA